MAVAAMGKGEERQVERSEVQQGMAATGAWQKKGIGCTRAGRSHR